MGNFQAFYQQGDRVERNILAGPSSSADCLSGAVYGFITETRLYHRDSALSQPLDLAAVVYTLYTHMLVNTYVYHT